MSTSNGKIAELRHSISILTSQQISLVSKGIKTDEQRKAYDDAEKQIAELNSDIARLERLEALRNDPRFAAAAPAPLSTSDVRAAVTSAVTSMATSNAPKTEARKRELNQAFRSFFKNGGITAETRDVLVDADMTGGALVPQEYDSAVLTTALYNYAPLVTFAQSKLSDDGAEARFPALDDQDAASTIVAEGSTVPETDPALYSRAVSTDTYASKILVSNQLWQDTDFSITDVVNGLSLARSFRALESSIITGADKAANAAPNSANLLSVVPVAATTTSLAAGIGWDDLVNVFEALDSAYLPFARWYMSSKTRSYLASLKTAIGSPLLTTADNGVEKILGLPVTLCESLPSVTISGGGTASTIPVLVGSMKHGLAVKYSRPSVRVFGETHAELNSTLCQITIRAGSAQLVPAALQGLKLAAS